MSAERLVARQLATVRMLRSENKMMLNGEPNRITFSDWAKWLDIDLEDIITLQEYCSTLDVFELADRALNLNTHDAFICKYARAYLNLYGIVICKIACDGDSQKIYSFLNYSIEAYVDRLCQTEHLTSDLSIAKDAIYDISLRYLSLVADAVDNTLLAGYTWDVITEMCDFFKSNQDYKTFKQNIANN